MSRSSRAEYGAPASLVAPRNRGVKRDELHGQRRGCAASQLQGRLLRPERVRELLGESSVAPARRRVAVCARARSSTRAVAFPLPALRPGGGVVEKFLRQGDLEMALAGERVRDENIRDGDFIATSVNLDRSNRPPRMHGRAQQEHHRGRSSAAVSHGLEREAGFHGFGEPGHKLNRKRQGRMRLQPQCLGLDFKIGGSFEEHAVIDQPFRRIPQLDRFYNARA